jgi:hypothetical protein
MKVSVHQRSASLRCYYRRRDRRFAAGLTSHGKPRKRVFKKYFTRTAKRAAANEQQRRWHNKRTAENNARGLTERGTVPVNRKFPQLRGLQRPEYDRAQYHVLKDRRIRAGLSALIAGKGRLITRFK